MSYTINDRLSDAISEALAGELDRDKIEEIWEPEVEPILDKFQQAEREAWRAVEALIAKHGEE